MDVSIPLPLPIKKSKCIKACMKKALRNLSDPFNYHYNIKMSFSNQKVFSSTNLS
jgi:hypothetical protein